MFLAAGREGTAASDGTANPKPKRRLSVIIPLGDERLNGAENVACWSQRQTRAPQDFEIVAVADGTDPVMESEVAEILRAHDKWVSCPPSEHVLGRLARGAKHADADLLFLGEHHCPPDPNCVDVVIRFFEERPETTVAMLRMNQRPGTAHGDLDERWFGELEQEWVGSIPGMRLRSGFCVMRKDQYFALGGQDGRYGLFADEILSARAYRAGLEVAKIADTEVHHVTATMREHQHHVEDFTRGDCAYRATHELEPWEEDYFGHVHIWANRLALNPSVARAAAVAVTQVLLHELSTSQLRRFFSLTRELIVLLRSAITRLELASAWIATRWSELRVVYLSRGHANRWKHYRNAWQRMIRYARLRAALESNSIPPDIPLTPKSWPIIDIPERQRVGFFGLGLRNDIPFRWSEPVMMLRIARPAGRTSVTITMTRGRGKARDFVRGVFWGGKLVPEIEISVREIRFTIDVASTSPQWLVLIVDPLKDKRGPRRLGLPITGLTFRPT